MATIGKHSHAGYDYSVRFVRAVYQLEVLGNKFIIIQ